MCFSLGGRGEECRGYSPTKDSGYPACESAAVGGRKATPLCLVSSSGCGHMTAHPSWDIQGGSNMTGTDLYVNKPHCAAAVRP